MSIDEFNAGPTQAPDEEAEGFVSTLFQQELWREHAAGAGSARNLAMRWLVRGRLSHEAAEAALNLLVQRHEILRTHFREHDGEILQMVRPHASIKVREIDLGFLGDDEKRARADEIANAEANDPFNLSDAPLLRATLMRFSTDKAMLLMSFHSIVADGWSIGHLVGEFKRAAAAFDAGATPQLAAPDLQFADYALWEKELLASGALETSANFWRRQLAGATATQIEPDHPDAVRRLGTPSKIVSQLLGGELTRQIDAFAAANGLTLYAIAASALAILLQRITGRSDVVFGSQVANRQDAAAETVIGPVLNAITLRLPVDQNEALADIAKGARAVIQEALSHEHLPFAAVPCASGLHAINLVVQRDYSELAQAQAKLPHAIELTGLPSLASGVLFDLNFFMVGRAEGWRISCQINCDLYDSATGDQLLGAWRRCLQALVTSPQTKPSECDLINQTPRRISTRPARSAARAQPVSASPFVASPARQIVRFNERGTRTPVIALNNRFMYYPLAEHLGADRPIIDIQLHHPDGPFELPRRAFEDFAADAVRLIRTAEPRGPYVIAGFCVYGALALEAARQLRCAGEETVLVALFDTWAPGYRETMPFYDKWLRRGQLRLSALKRHAGKWSERLDRFQKGELRFDQIAPPSFARLFDRARVPDEQLPGAWFDGYLSNAVKDHRPKPYDGDVIVIRSCDSRRCKGRVFDDKLGWGALVTGRLRVADVDAAHMDMLNRRQIGDIAAHLNAMLGEVESPRSRGD